VQLDLGNSANWEPLYSINEKAQFFSEQVYQHLDPIEIPIQIEVPILAAFAESEAAAPRWKSAGFISPRYALGITVGGRQDGNDADSKRVLLNRITFLRWPTLASSSGLTFSVHSRLWHIKLNLWQYVGPVDDATLQAVELVRIDILRTESKVDALFREMPRS
jgi:hypothetical protein